MIYKNLELLSEDLHGWNGTHSIFEKLIEETRPEIIIEVGSWKGQSTITMVNALKKNDLKSKVFCVDTWLGALEFLTWGINTPERNLLLKNGYPQIYYQFLSNIVHNDATEYVIPIPNTSTIGAKYLKHNNVKSKLIYIDASHEEDDVYNDLIAYHELIEDGGIMFGDDFTATWPGVVNSVKRFASEINKAIEIIDGNFWIIKF